MNKKIIFLDFDGVLFDSVKEAYLLARYAYYGIPVKYEIDKEHYQKFRKYRYLITHSWHFYIIFSLIEKNTNNKDFEKLYNHLLNYETDANIIEFDNKYVSAREELINNDYVFWDNLDTPFDFFFEIKKLSKFNNYKFIILTNKKKLPVKNKLKKYDADNFEIFANEDLKIFNNKAEFINNYLKQYKIQECYLIEDSIDNIITCQKYSNIKCLLTNWGYINPKEEGLTKEEIINYIKV